MRRFLGASSAKVQRVLSYFVSLGKFILPSRIRIELFKINHVMAPFSEQVCSRVLEITTQKMDFMTANASSSCGGSLQEVDY